MTNIYKFNVAMTCSGCSGAVERVLKRLEGVESSDISLENQTVVVTATTATKEQVYEAIKKTGKAVTPIES
ncbi:heavy metal-associated domain-containing protein [Piptocephalis cylindrospora]|uniref:Heavy metal-associated domain-containing protein n=1 Tax=Piptocephalis cylindrospora TaxID=1907219 RepID=A0A4P9Y4W1_9FUNG|nr:heavy metal-associated domain-containing protein [Piptocephalis cylindrospora]|eukprot:RKP13201.1 heavy metal-associated domain-containing protein [Piptocephalis cylindrospora]